MQLCLGINVNASWTYNASFYYMLPTGSNFKGAITVALESMSGQRLASASVPVTGVLNVWTQVTVPLNPTSSPDTTNNTFTVTVDGASASGETLYFSLFSLFPPTFKNRPNGMRVDIATVSPIHGSSYVVLLLNHERRRYKKLARLSSDSQAEIILFAILSRLKFHLTSL